MRARGQTKAHPLIWRQDLQPPFRSKQEVIINAPLEAVWSFSMDLTKIPEFHPRVVKVDLLSGKTIREPGASYQCHLSGGKHTCIEKDIEIIPLQKIVTVLPEDTFSISKILSDYRVETTFQTLGHRSLVEMALTRLGISSELGGTCCSIKRVEAPRLLGQCGFELLQG